MQLELTLLFECYTIAIIENKPDVLSEGESICLMWPVNIIFIINFYLLLVLVAHKHDVVYTCCSCSGDRFLLQLAAETFLLSELTFRVVQSWII